jgi:Rrf2 family protein
MAMLQLAVSAGEPQPVRIKTIHDATGIPLRFLVQILLQLKTAGLVASVRGAAGGYQLARSPETISLAAIITAIDDRTLAPTSALTKVLPSPVVDALLGAMREIQREEQRMLEEVTLAELLRRAQEKDIHSYQI